VDALDAVDAVWFGTAPGEWTACTLQVRAHGAGVPARVRAVGSGAQVRVDGPLRGVAPGQSAVLYGGADGDRVLGQATVDRAHRAVAAGRRA